MCAERLWPIGREPLSEEEIGKSSLLKVSSQESRLVLFIHNLRILSTRSPSTKHLHLISFIHHDFLLELLRLWRRQSFFWQSSRWFARQAVSSQSSAGNMVHISRDVRIRKTSHFHPSMALHDTQLTHQERWRLPSLQHCRIRCHHQQRPCWKYQCLPQRL